MKSLPYVKLILNDFVLDNYVKRKTAHCFKRRRETVCMKLFSTWLLETTIGSTVLQIGKFNREGIIVFYLAPGDYHRFHSPVDWKVQQRRYYSFLPGSWRLPQVSQSCRLESSTEKVIPFTMQFPQSSTLHHTQGYLVFAQFIVSNLYVAIYRTYCRTEDYRVEHCVPRMEKKSKRFFKNRFCVSIELRLGAFFLPLVIINYSYLHHNIYVA